MRRAEMAKIVASTDLFVRSCILRGIFLLAQIRISAYFLDICRLKCLSQGLFFSRTSSIHRLHKFMKLSIIS